jgi:hypothetical protein
VLSFSDCPAGFSFVTADRGVASDPADVPQAATNAADTTMMPRFVTLRVIEVFIILWLHIYADSLKRTVRQLIAPSNFVHINGHYFLVGN